MHTTKISRHTISGHSLLKQNFCKTITHIPHTPIHTSHIAKKLSKMAGNKTSNQL